MQSSISCGLYFQRTCLRTTSRRLQQQASVSSPQPTCLRVCLLHGTAALYVRFVECLVLICRHASCNPADCPSTALLQLLLLSLAAVAPPQLMRSRCCGQSSFQSRMTSKTTAAHARSHVHAAVRTTPMGPNPHPLQAPTSPLSCASCWPCLQNLVGNTAQQRSWSRG